MRKAVFAVISVFAVLLGAMPAAAQSVATLSGVVYGGSTPLANATVEALANGTTNAVATSVTNSSGQYSLEVSTGTYDLRVIPPQGSGFGEEVVQDVEVTANRQYDIILLSNGGGPTTKTISGVFRGHQGAAIPNVWISVYSSSDWQYLASTSTDANGYYTVTAAATAVHIRAEAWGAAAAPSYWRYYRYNFPLNSAAVTNDVALPVGRLTGTVVNADDVPLEGASLSGYSSSWNSETQVETYSNFSAYTNATGEYSALTVLGNGSINVYPPSGNTAPRLAEPLTVTGDAVRNFKFAPELARRTVSGYVRGHGGQPIANAYVALYSSNWENSTGASTDANGFYSLITVATQAHVRVEGWGSATTPSYWRVWRYNMPVDGDTAYDINVPVVRMSGTVFTADNVAAPAASLAGATSSWDSVNQVETYSNFNAATDASGAYAFLTLAGSGSLTVYPPAGNTSPRLNESFTIAQDTVRDFTFAPELPKFTVTGTVRGIGGQPLSNVWVVVYSGGWEHVGSVSTDANGVYSVTTTATTVHVRVEGWGIPGAPSYLRMYRYNVPVPSSPTTIDLDLNIVRLNGTAADSNGSPVQGVGVSAQTSRWNDATQTETYSNNSTSSDASGAYASLLLAGSGSVQIQPPSGSGFSNVNLNNVNLNNNLTQRIVLQRPDSTPPVIVTRPVVVHLSDTSVSVGWTTDEPATSRVDYGVGGLSTQLSSTTLKTNHSITLIDLLPTAVYGFRVSSSDRAGNGPTSSDIGYFTTQAPPGDITAPVITSGPAVAAASDSSAIIQWTTDEPATSVVEYGLSMALGNTSQSTAGQFVKNHSIALSGLQASTTYFVRVRSIDPDGNGPTSSSIFSFTTAAAPDTQAPAIQGLTVISVTDDSITVAWTTNEAATSGVSYNDGSTYFVVSDPALVTRHEITLAGLASQRTYNITVSSRDAGGNGPTLAGPIQATTLATADTTAPVISAVSIVPSKTSAAVTWSTNEASTSELRYGIVSAAPDGSVASLTLSTSHGVSLTGLTPDTTYYLTIRATDASGNAGTIAEVSFTTLSGSVNLPPTAPGPFTVSSNPNRTGNFMLTWGASTDDNGPIASYEVFRNGRSVQLLAGDLVTSFSETGLAEGQYTYRVVAADGAGLTTESVSVVVIVDQTAPALQMPADISAPATTAIDAIVTFSVTATDANDPSPVVACKPVSGSVFAIGSTAVKCTATDTAGNVTNGSFTVEVTDPFPPVLTVPADFEVDTTNPAGAVVNFTVTATDNHDASPAIACVPASGTTFAVGKTTVVCTATDAAGNKATRSFAVTVNGPATSPTTTALSFAPASPVYGQAVTFTATISTAGVVTGNVEFYDGATLLGTTTVANGVATFTATSLSVGAHSITASYAGDDTHTASTSPAVNVTVGKAAVTVSVSDASFVYDGTAHTVSGSATGINGENLGAPVITYNGSPVPPVNAGTYDVIATFAGNATYQSASATSVLTITPAVTSATLTIAPAAAVFGQSVRVEASVAVTEGGGSPAGTVEFFEGTVSLGSAPVSNGSAFVTRTFPLGAHTFSARYSGASNFRPSQAAAAQLTVSRAATTTALVSAPNPSGYAQPVNMRAAVTINTPGVGVATGTVQFFNGTTLVATAPLVQSNGIATASIVAVGMASGTHSLTAVYSGDASFTASTSAAIAHTVQNRANSTETRLSTSQNPAAIGDPLTIEAEVSAITGSGDPTGSIQFFDGTTPLGSPVSLALIRGKMRAQITVNLAAGIHSLTAAYSGDGVFSASVSAAMSQTIYDGPKPTKTTTTVSSSPNKSKAGDPVTFTAKVKSTGNGAATGTVQFYINGVAEGGALTVPASETVSIVKTGLMAGTHTITVQYVPDVTTLAGSSGETTHTVQ